MHNRKLHDVHASRCVHAAVCCLVQFFFHLRLTRACTRARGPIRIQISNAASMLQWTGNENICQRHLNSRGRPRIFHVPRTTVWEAHRSSSVGPTSACSSRLLPPSARCE